MHHDRISTHVISSIVHIAHQYDNDSEPWPIQIEDHDGNLHSVNLNPGEMLHYESAKCLHGRMRVLKGKYYGSIFIHYAPINQEIWSYTHDDVIAAVPPHWKDNLKEDQGTYLLTSCSHTVTPFMLTYPITMKYTSPSSLRRFIHIPH